MDFFFSFRDVSVEKDENTIYWESKKIKMKCRDANV